MLKQVHMRYEWSFQWMKTGAHELWIEVPVNENRCTWVMNRGSSEWKQVHMSYE